MSAKKDQAQVELSKFDANMLQQVYNKYATKKMYSTKRQLSPSNSINEQEDESKSEDEMMDGTTTKNSSKDVRPYISKIKQAGKRNYPKYKKILFP